MSKQIENVQIQTNSYLMTQNKLKEFTPMTRSHSCNPHFRQRQRLPLGHKLSALFLFLHFNVQSSSYFYHPTLVYIPFHHLADNTRALYALSYQNLITSHNKLCIVIIKHGTGLFFHLLSLVAVHSFHSETRSIFFALVPFHIFLNDLFHFVPSKDSIELTYSQKYKQRQKTFFFFCFTMKTAD